MSFTKNSLFPAQKKRKICRFLLFDPVKANQNCTLCDDSPCVEASPHIATN